METNQAIYCQNGLGVEAEAGSVQSACPGCLRRGDAGRPRYLGEFRTPLALIVANPWGVTRVWVVGFRFEKRPTPAYVLMVFLLDFDVWADF